MPASPRPPPAPTSPAGGGHYIHAEKLRHTTAEAAAALARPGRYHDVANNLRVNEIRVAPDGGTNEGRARNGSWCATTRIPPTVTPRCVTGSSSDEVVGSLTGKPGCAGWCGAPRPGCCASTAAAASGCCAPPTTLTAEDLAAAYQQLIAVERGWRDCKTSLGLRPVYHHRGDGIRAHVQLCWLALLLIRVAETRTGDTWRNLRHELDRMHLVTFATADGRVAQRSALTGDQKTILTAMPLSRSRVRPKSHRVWTRAARVQNRQTAPPYRNTLIN